MDFCICDSWCELKNQNRDLFKQDPTYGWVLCWLEVTEDKGYSQIHRYGIPIKFCPMCGNPLKEK